MNIQEIYNLAIKMGIEADFRGKEAIERLLKRRKEKYERLLEKEKEEFDREALENPYLDSRILNISQDREIKKILVGIDIEPAEILLAKEIGNIDLIISHHPLGKGLANLSEVMELQCDVLNQYGVPVNYHRLKMVASCSPRTFPGWFVEYPKDGADRRLRLREINNSKVLAGKGAGQVVGSNLPTPQALIPVVPTVFKAN